LERIAGGKQVSILNQIFDFQDTTTLLFLDISQIGVTKSPRAPKAARAKSHSGAACFPYTCTTFITSV
jgi:hypothetical protein